MHQVPSETQPEEKKKKKKKNKKKNQDIKEGTNADQIVTAREDKNRSTSDSEQKQTDAKSSKVRNFSNGLVIEELAMGKPDGERASPGKQVSFKVDDVLPMGCWLEWLGLWSARTRSAIRTTSLAPT